VRLPVVPAQLTLGNVALRPVQALLDTGAYGTFATMTLATRLGLHAADVVAEEAWGQMVSLKGTDIVRVPFEEALGELNTVPIYRYEEAAALFG
jgi:hypothetical protein